MTTPLPPHSGALPGGRGVKPTVTTTIASDSRPSQVVGIGVTGASVSAPAASGRGQINDLPAQGSVAQGRAPSSLDGYALIPGLVADRPKPEQDPLSTRFYG
jgi:hypothetical protein